MSSEVNSGCPLCKCKDFNPFITGFDRVFSRIENFYYVKCLKCHMVYLHPIPSFEKIATFYGSEYGPHQEGKIDQIQVRHKKWLNLFLIKNYFNPQISHQTKKGLKYYIAKLISKFAFKNIISPHGSCRLLDVGCGSGGWLYQHHALGWTAEGVEMNASACDRARNLGMNVFHGTIFDVPKDKQYDIISFNHVIEHVPNPVETLLCAKELLAPGGLIYLLLPNLDSYGFEKYGNCWFPLDPPRHILQFSIETMGYMADKVGLKIKSLKTLPKPRFILKSYLYKKFLRNNYIDIEELEKRKQLIQNCAAKERSKSIFHKTIKRLFYLQNIFCNYKNGEVMKIFLQKNN
ncbi:MAG: methyltransferase type 12 [uncultured bacterium]|nr:MAG: methyltransferase type 12 [uncultured bacterium]